METHLITGATGFVGGAMVLELLSRTDDCVIALVRAPSNVAATRRIREYLCATAAQYGRIDLIDHILSRVHAVNGDITRDSCAVDVEALPRIKHVWHSAATLEFEEESAADIRRINVQGTKNVLDIAATVQAEAFTYVSTAFVAGMRSGVVPEGPVGPDVMPSNAYEASKIEAERLVEAAAPTMHVCITRPSIVVGHRKTHHCVGASGMYGFIRHLVGLRQAARHSPRALPRIVADAQTPINLVPIDRAAREIVAAGLARSNQRYFHVVSEECPTLGEALPVVAAEVGIPCPDVAGTSATLTGQERAVATRMKFFAPYLQHPKTFDRTHIRQVAQFDDATFTLNDLRAMVRYFLLSRGGGGDLIDLANAGGTGPRTTVDVRDAGQQAVLRTA